VAKGRVESVMCYEVIGDSNTKVIAIKALKRKVIYGGKVWGNNVKDSVNVETAKEIFLSAVS
jgi:hypothetical protein